MKTREVNLFFLIIIILLIIAQLFLPLGLMYLHISQNFWTLILEVLFLVIPSIIYLKKKNKPIKETLRINPLNAKSVGIIFIIAVLSQPLMMFLSVLSQLFFHNDVADAFNEMSRLPYLAILGLIALTPAICEETVLRGVVLSGYKNVNLTKAAIMNGLLFGIFHLGPQQFLYAFALGVVFVYIVEATNSILGSMLCHFFINGSSATLSYVAGKFSNDTKGKTTEFSAQSPSVIIGTLIFFLILAVIFTILLIMVVQELDKANGGRLTLRRKAQFSEGQQEKVMTGSIYVTIGLYLVFVTIVQLLS